MTTPDLPADRPIPDTDDLRLLAELINNEFIPVANAAWNARMSQAEAARRLVEMAERGMPLRLVADGDRQALWHIAQAGPATGAVAVTGPPPPAPSGATMPAPAPAFAPGPPAAPFGQAPPVPPAVPPPAAAPEAPPVGPAAGPVGPVAGPPPGYGPAPLSAPSAAASSPGPVVATGGAPAVPGVPPPASGPVVLPPSSPVPPHEQAIAGAVPLGRPPFGAAEPPRPEPAPESGSAPAESAEPGRPADDSPASGAIETHGSPGAAREPEPSPDLPESSAQPAEPAEPAERSEPAEPAGSVESAGSVEPAGSPFQSPDPSVWEQQDRSAEATQVVAPDFADAPPAAPPYPSHVSAEPAPRAAEDFTSQWGPAGSSSWARADESAGSGPASTGAAAAAAAHPEPPVPAAPRWASLPVAGPSGEQLVVSILAVVDPGDQVLTDAGYRMEPGQRAVLVHSSVANTGPAHYYPVGDLNLVLETNQRVLLGRANVAVASHPAFPVGVAPGRAADGWSVFLIPSDTVLAGLKWCIRPDVPQTILSWPITP